MKTQVIHLESYDDLHAVLDKLNWSQAERLILVWPLRAQVLNHKLDLLRVQRHCQTRGAKLALVTRSNQIQDDALQLGIPVFRSLRRAQSVAWEYTLPQAEDRRPPRPARTPWPQLRQQLREGIRRQPTPTWQDQPAARWALFSAGLLAALALLVFFLPSAEVHLSPQTETQQLALTLTAGPRIPTYNLSGAVPAQRLTVTVEGRDTIPAGGEITLPESNATGFVVFTNLTDRDITVPSGTVISTFEAQPVRFATLAEIQVPAKGRTSNYLPVEALNPGPDANLEVGAIQVIEGLLSLDLTVTNPTATSGGLDRTSKAPTPQDYDAISSQLLEQLWLTALDEARAGLDPLDLILESAPRTLALLEESFTPEEPQPSSELSLLLRVEFEFTVLPYETLQQMGNAILDATLEPGHRAQREGLVILPQSAPEFADDGTVSVDVLITRPVYATAGHAQALNAVLGARPGRARDILASQLDLETPPQITLNPAWWPWMPLIEMRIDLQDQE